MKTTQNILFCSLIIMALACNNNKKEMQEVLPGLEIIPASESGITFQNTLADNPLTNQNILSDEYYFNGAGVGIGDFNNDGLQDVFFAGNEVDNQIFINKGDFKFEKLENAGINTNKFRSSGVCVVDINNDGYQDIYVSQQGLLDPSQRQNLFFINNGDLTFTESAKEMGLDDPNISTQATFFDYDKDGDLDCYVLNESKYVSIILSEVYKDLENKDRMREASGKLFENLGNLKFQDVTEKAGVLDYGYGLGISISDFNNDNWPDIYVANDYSVPDFMYINQKDGTFKEAIKDYTHQISYFAMGCDVADINNDGLVDIGVVDMAAEDHFRDKTLMAGMDPEGFKYYFYELEYQFQYMFNSMQINNGNNTFSNIAALSGVLKSDWSWAALLVDLNLDGYKDYYVSNGYRRYSRDNDFRNYMSKIREENNGTVPLSMREEIYAMLPEVKIVNKLYINDKNLHFDADSDAFSHPEYETYSYGVAYADFDNDGDFDMIVNNIDQDALLLKNTIREKSDNRYLKIKLDGNNQVLPAGSKVYVYTGDEIQLQEYFFQRGYESSMEQVLLFGLSQKTKIDSVRIQWPDDNVQVLKSVDTNQSLTIQYEKQHKRKLAAPVEQPLLKQLNPQELAIDYKHQENYFDDFEKEVLLPQKQSYFGPALTIGDINNDGLEDFYVGGAKGQSGALYIQTTEGKFEALKNAPWTADFMYEDVDAVFIDPNQDGNLDLLVISGGSGDFVGEEQYLQDRFYANLGNNRFGRIANILPESFTASYSVVAENIDSDPEKEILIIGAAVPGQYPRNEATILLDYQNQKFVNITLSIVPELADLDGLVRDACWVDINNDGHKDLITVGEWQNMALFISDGKALHNKTAEWIEKPHLGWWRSIEAADLDNDGDMDFVVGNIGKNFKQKASEDHPLYLFSNDFDDNGTLDCVLAKDYKDKIVPTRGRQCSSEQMPFISDKFKTFKAFASSNIVEILGKEKIEGGIKLKATEFNSFIVWNEGNTLTFEKMPVMAQISPVNDILVDDFNGDKLMDIIIVGNDYNTEYETPRLDAGYGLLMLNKGQRQFSTERISSSGIYCPNDAKKIKKINLNGKDLLMVANNNNSLDLFIKT